MEVAIVFKRHEDGRLLILNPETMEPFGELVESGRKFEARELGGPARGKSRDMQEAAYRLGLKLGIYGV